MRTACSVTTPVGGVGVELDKDAELVKGCVAGDRCAMSALYQRYQRRVFSLMLRMVGRSDAEELTQDVFLRIFRGLSNFRGDAALSTWVYRLAMNVCLSFLARRKRRQRLDERFEVPPAETTAAAPDGNPWLRQQLEAALVQLSPGYRAVLVLHDVEGLNHQEISTILGCRVGTSKSQLHKARMKMRDLLGPAALAGEVRL